MNILVLNVGSSSVKVALYRDEHELFHLNLDRVHTAEQRKRAVSAASRAVKLAGCKVNAVAHRIVHGGSLEQHCIITPLVMKKLRHVANLAPLHDIPELEVVTFCKSQFNCKQIAVFDTAFHSKMPTRATIYGLPYSYFERGFRKYGFHGISHEFVSRGVRGKVISCHLGNGCSVAAIKNGKSVDTSMGFTPLEGLIMGTRSGSFDPGLFAYLMDEGHNSVKHMKDLLNHESGLLGISGISSDMRDLLAVEKRRPRAKLAIDAFCYCVAKTIGAYASAMNGIDSLIFTGGIGQNSARIRKLICVYLTHLGVRLDTKRNKANAQLISVSKSRVKVLVRKTNEELAMVKIAAKLIK